ncbi:MAG: MaoC family dehydratase [Actinomycetota bacterium]|nr:MaoC family dehydratase [Actinomycetota bacterium]
MHTFASPEETLRAVGQTYGPGAWLEITQERVDAFADATGDHQWIHVDPERAATGPFGGTIAHGYLTLSLVPMLGAYVLAYGGCSAKLNYGTEQVRFPQAVRVGSRVRAHASIADAQRTDAGVRVTVRWTLEIEDEPKPACVADTVVLLVP